MKTNVIYTLILFVLVSSACQSNKSDKYIDEDQLGIIDASVKSEETNLDEKAEYENIQPGVAEKIDRSFENAPPLIPHTTIGFFPIKKDNNICLSCHMPDMVPTSGAVAIPATHFINMRPKMVEINGVLQFKEEGSIHIQTLDSLNQAYFNCSQCHVPQANVSVNIENLFTPEFREEHGLVQSSLKGRLKEGVE